jgi:NAD(P)-dependent dehydrogenase (short-subunit alcohol dehydrogenase family)
MTIVTGAASDSDTLGRRLAQTLLEHGGAALLRRSPSSLLLATKNGGNLDDHSTGQGDREPQRNSC